MAAAKAGRKAVIVAGMRTPFVKSFGELYAVDAIGLGASCVGGLIKKTGINPEKIDNIVWGNVVLQTSAPNVAREIVIDLNLPKHIVAHTVGMACASGLQAITSAQTLIEGGHADIIVAGGSDSLSCAEFSLPRKTAHGLALSTQYAPKKWGIMQRVKNFGKVAGGFSPKNFFPSPPAVAERSTGKTMGYHADLMAELNKVPRDAQEAFALRSHRNATSARDAGVLAEEISPTEMDGKVVTQDNLIQPDLSVMEKKMPTMKPAFRKEVGTVVAATSSALTDGGSCVLIMSEQKAKELGFATDISISAWQYTAIDPYPQLLMAPALGWHPALDKAGLKIEDIDRFEIHEAFSAQVLSTIVALESEEFCQRHLGRKALPKIDQEKLNVNGSSIAIGHPFAATGGRLVTSAMNELRRSKKKHALLSICAAGGLGAVAIVSRA